jgi:hypothetical protein
MNSYEVITPAILGDNENIQNKMYCNQRNIPDSSSYRCREEDWWAIV